MSARVAVAASNTLAAAAGVRLAGLGGNAVDAAVATALVSTVCEPGVCALAGGGFVTVAPADGSPAVTVDGNVEMPGRGLPPHRFRRGMWQVHTGYGGGVDLTVGHGSVATPGTPAALEVAQRTYGRAPWPEVVAPAVEVARDGFPLGAASAYYLGFVHDTVFGWHPDSAAAVHAPDGRPLGLGETVRVAHLAESLELIADEGTAAFYRGPLAAAIAEDMAAHGGLLTAADLAAYQPVVRPALPVTSGAWALATNPPPSIGGPVLAAMLTLLEDCPPDDVATLAAVQEAVLRYRFESLDLAEDRVAGAHELLDRAGAGLEHVRGARRVGSSAGSTVHISAVDSDGGACAVTASSGYGSGVMTPGTGLWLNNCLGEPELNRRGLHALPVGQRLPSNMAPTVGHGGDGSVLAIGSPGADRITSALAQVLHALGPDPARSLAAAIERPRLHVRVNEDGSVLVEHEADLALPQLPWPTRALPAWSMYFGGVGAALRTGDGELLAAADPRRAAAVAVGPAAD